MGRRVSDHPINSPGIWDFKSRLECRLMRFDILMYAYKDWLKKINADIHPKEARETVEKEYVLSDAEKAALSIPMQLELEMRIPKQ